MGEKKNPFWLFFTSVRLTIVLIALIVLLSIMGTLIPQQEGAQEFARKLSPGAARLFYNLQFFDLYHSFWFFILLGLFSLNLIICSLNRFPASWRQFRAKPSPDPIKPFDNLPTDRMVTSPENSDAVIVRIESLLRKRYGAVQREDTSRGTILMAEKGRASNLAVYLVHLSILVIIAGAMVGSLFGFEAHVNIEEGETVQALDLKGGKGVKKLDFSIRCDRFILEFYENGAPKTYRSDLTFLKNDKPLYQGALLVNHPISFEDIRFYQSSYGQTPEGKAEVSIAKGHEKPRLLTVRPDDVFEIPDAGARVQVLRVEEDMMQMGPALKLLIQAPNRNMQIWIFQNIEQIKQMNPGIAQQVPMFNPGLFAPYVFALEKIDQKFYTGLQAAYDPGVPLVAGGALLMIFGLIAVFFTFHRRIWVRIEEAKGNTRISVTGKSHKNPVGLEREIRRLLDEGPQERNA